jgi:hypothetical protein
VSPDPARSKREWKRLLAHLERADNFRSDFSEAIVRAEMPFLWRIDDLRCLEGVVDLALIDPINRKLRILDWKTDRVPPDSPDTLRKRYLSQLAAYWKAIGQITGFEISAAIYSTAAGELIRYETGELERAWALIEELPLDQFQMNITGPMARDRGETRQQLELFGNI